MQYVEVARTVDENCLDLFTACEYNALIQTMLEEHKVSERDFKMRGYDSIIRISGAYFIADRDGMDEELILLTLK